MSEQKTIKNDSEIIAIDIIIIFIIIIIIIIYYYYLT